MSRKLPTNQGEILYPAIGGVTPSAPPPSYEDVVEQVNNVNPGVGPQYIYPQPPIIGVSSPCGERYCPRGQIYIVDQHCGINGNSHCIESERRCAIRRKRRIIISE
ncbi:Hypothetical protein SRAE_1000293700 [Strongyloides ratti]|uniref:Uncharacterized protein n=1 Tax=Strongyloides ratti TaxID=34506 RepID=A0A090MX23_STRRB|nr:Hypothetical protein SRAE_1000293700 [Strongyloides ratti]CEF64684.1 Hypothetical protein SRAE_1000293700 [Strongyloides ratti]